MNKTKVIVVGNSAKLTERKQGKIIDTFDIVVRLNILILTPDITGLKTDIWYRFHKIPHAEMIPQPQVKIIFKTREVIQISRQMKLRGSRHARTGAIAIWDMLQQYGWITIAGFDLLGEKYDYYYGVKNSERRAPGHDFHGEQLWIAEMIKKGRIIELPSKGS